MVPLLFKLKAKLKYWFIRFNNNIGDILRIIWVPIKVMIELLLLIFFVVFAVYSHSWIVGSEPSNINYSLSQDVITEIIRHWCWASPPVFQIIFGVRNTVLFSFGLDPITGVEIFPIIFQAFFVSMFALWGTIFLFMLFYKISFIDQKVTYTVRHDFIFKRQFWVILFIFSILISSVLLVLIHIGFLSQLSVLIKNILLFILLLSTTGVYMVFNDKFQLGSVKHLLVIISKQVLPLMLSLLIILEALLNIGGVGLTLIQSLLSQDTPMIFASFYTLGIIIAPLRIMAGITKIEKKEIDETSSRVISTYLQG